MENEAAKGVSAAVRAGSTDDDGNYTAHNKALQTLHANVFWSPVPQANIGLEVMHGWREVHPQVDGSATEGEATRVQIGVQYGF